MSIHNLDNPPAQVVVLEIRNRVIEDLTQLLQTALGLRSLGRGPLPARAVKQRGLRRKARIVGSSLRFRDSAHIRSVGSSAGHGVATKAQRGEGRRGGGQGDCRALVNRAASLLVVLSKTNKTSATSGESTERREGKGEGEGYQRCRR